MSDQTIPTGQELYDQIMAGIEPELVSTVIPTLKEKYKDEAPEQTTARAERYEKAYDRFDAAFDEYLAAMDRDLHTYRRQAISTAEEKAKVNESQLESSILDQIASA